MPPRSGAASGYSSWPRRDGPTLSHLQRGHGLRRPQRGTDFDAVRAASPRTAGLRPTHPPEATMRFYTGQHRFYCGVDLHTRTLSLCVLDSAGAIALEATLPPEPERLLAALAPYRAQLVVGRECLFAWYWLADWCAAEGIPFVLGH